LPDLDDAFWQEIFERTIDLIVSIWLDAMWEGALSVVGVMDEAGLPHVDEGALYDSILDWISQNAPYQASLIWETTRSAVEKAIELWNGEDEQQLEDLLEPIFGESRAETIGMTEAILAATMGNLLGWDIYGIIEEVIWMTAEDERVCPICRPKHETVIQLYDALYGGDRPPAHARCRCWLEAILILKNVPVIYEAVKSGRVSLENIMEVARVVQV